MKAKFKVLIVLLYVSAIVALVWGDSITVSRQVVISGFIIMISIVLLIQGGATLLWMLFTWESPRQAELNASPKEFYTPRYSFTALVPARHEEAVIQDTILAVDRIDYPEHLKEVLVLIREDDTGTLEKAQEIITALNKPNIRLITFNDDPINKPHSLNIGLDYATTDVVTIFDAEDEPHPEIYDVINTVMVRDGADVVQSGVQLMDFNSHWYSLFNVLEYFFWFKSGLHFFSSVGKVTPLGGNTVFFKTHWVRQVGGWDETNLTEDADIGIRLAIEGAKIRIVYDSKHATQEETPPTLKHFIKQRTRWNQGFIQVFLKSDWRRLNNPMQRLIVLYVLLDPILLSILLFYLPVGLILAFTQTVPVLVALFSFVPGYFLLIQLVLFVLGFIEFRRAYDIKAYPAVYAKILLAFYPYQIALMAATMRALYRTLTENTAWEKTAHTNTHRTASPVATYASNTPRVAAGTNVGNGGSTVHKNGLKPHPDYPVIEQG